MTAISEARSYGLRLEAGNFDKYLAALPDIARGTPQVIAERVMTETLLVNKVLANSLFASLIVLLGNGVIQSENFLEGERGLRLLANGNAELYNAIIRGHIIADSGSLGVVHIEEQAVFKGRIIGDNLIVDYDPSSVREFGPYASGTPQDTVRNDVFNFIGEVSRILLDDGQFGNISIRAILFRTATQSRPWIQVEEINGQLHTAANIGENLRNSLWFRLGTGGKQIRFLNIPTNPGAVMPGTVYRNGNQLMIV